ncbi:MAG: excinuclease ABC subunit UvrA [Deltaproteobacteria bacterium]|nr:excinuclease ABC subunit UvrA [Deltaproteobacteria bacterium]
MQSKPPIRIINAKQNNLKNISLEIPSRKMTVITGVLAFDTLYAEGQRRFIESLSTYTRQFLQKMPKPDVDQIENISPSIALEQKNHVVNSRSTVGTQTEIIDYFRLLFAKIGKTICQICGGTVQKLESQNILEQTLKWLPDRKALVLAPLLIEKTKAKSTKKSTTKHLYDSVFEILKEQGFSRIFIKDKHGKGEICLIENISAKFVKNINPDSILHIVVDRLKITSENNKDIRSRVLDAIEQALAIGKGKILFYDLDTQEEKIFDARFACVECGKEYQIPNPDLFSFNNPLGACAQCSGFGYTLDLDESLVVPEPTKTLKNGAIDPLAKPFLSDWQENLFHFAEKLGISIGKRYSELTPNQKKLIWEGDPKNKGLNNTFLGIKQCFEELKKWKYKLHVRVFIRRYQSQNLCTHCKGSRLNADVLAIKINNNNIAEIANFTVTQCLTWLKILILTPYEKKLTLEIFLQIIKRLEFLEEVGVGYLTLARLTKTLAGGEFQRINIATQLGNGLCGTLYVLDEPSIGLHAADTEKLIKILHRLRDQGNTVVVVEHDLEVMRQSDHLIELGPGAGKNGGELIAQGSFQDLIDIPASLTGKYLSRTFELKRTLPPRPKHLHSINITGCRENNLKNLTVEFPLDRFIVVTGVSGSGKSTLVHKTLYNALAKIFYRSTEKTGAFDYLYGAENLGGVVLLDQSPIGKSSRSNPVTYMKTWDEFRRLFANQTISVKRGYNTQHFSFNVDGGRCPSCKGEGEISVDMHFMAEIKLPCEECDGKRFQKNILEITCRGKNIHELLQTTVNEAFDIFRDNPILQRKLNILRSVGLGYLQLGQSSTTLSGGEAQRLKIARALDQEERKNLLYIFDEPTTGLHSEDIKKLLLVIQDLIERKNSILMIEHNLDVIAQADWVIDLGPSGGDTGGELLASCHPKELLEAKASITGEMLGLLRN